MFLTMLTTQVFYANIKIMILLITICYQQHNDILVQNELHAGKRLKISVYYFDKERQPRTLHLNHNVTIQSVSNVTLLGVNMDVELNFNYHIALLCNTAGKQIHALSRLSNVLNVDTKILILQSFILSI